jgi:crotonobetainyl-CoA:carnitine CoA-transferase CaiB-like acyl-CoA transferase
LQVEGVQAIGIPVKLSRTPGRVHSAPPRFGQHTRELLIEHGYDSATVDAKSRKVQLFSTFKNNPPKQPLR